MSHPVDGGPLCFDGRPEPDLPWVPFAVCLLAGLAAAALVSPRPQPMPDQAAWTVAKALLAVLLSSGCTAMVARMAVPYFTAYPEEQAYELAWSCGVIGAWFAPIAVLAAQHLVLAIPAALACGLAAGWLVRDSAHAMAALSPSEGYEPALMFSRRYPGALTRGLGYSVAGTAILEAAAASAVAGYLSLAVLLTGTGSLLLAATAPLLKQPLNRKHPPARFLLQAGLALLMASVALVPLPAKRTFVVGGLPSREQASAGDRLSGTDLISGAILLADTRAATEITLPPPRGHARFTRRRSAPPPTIPFSGVYWVLASPHSRPTASAKVFHDSPVSYNFTAGLHGFLTMQAHQQLPSPLDPSCCAALELTILNEDPLPHTVALEVVLTTSEMRRAPWQSLGLQAVLIPGQSVLRYPIPARPQIATFDRIIVDYHLLGKRFKRSANVEIVGFAFVPRSL